MPALPLQRVTSFLLVGGAATLFYMVVALIATMWLGLPASVSSLAAYVFASVLSYAGHRRLTFQSRLPHLQTVPKFTALTAVGYLIAIVTPLLLTDMLGAPAAGAIILTSVAIPVLNAFVLGKIIFNDKSSGFRGLDHGGDELG